MSQTAAANLCIAERQNYRPVDGVDISAPACSVLKISTFETDMILRLQTQDLKPNFTCLPIQDINFDSFQENVKQVIQLVGLGIYHGADGKLKRILPHECEENFQSEFSILDFIFSEGK